MSQTITKPKPALARVIGVLGVAAATVAAEYGSGVNYVLVNALGAYPGVTYLVPVAIVAAGLLLGPAVLLFARFAQALPRAGSVYVWMTRTVGYRIGFAASVLYFVGVLGSIGFQSYGFAVFFANLLGAVGWREGAGLAGSSGGHLLLGGLLILVFTLVQLRGIHSFGTIMTVMLAMVLVVVALTVIVGLTHSHSDFVAHVADLLGHPVAQPATNTPQLGAFLAVLVLFVYSYGGVSAAPSLGGETRDGATLARGLARGWLIAIVLYAAVSFSIFHAVPWYAVPPLVHEGHQDAASVPGIVAMLAPQAITIVFDLLVVIVAGKTVAPLMVDCARMMFAWSEDDLLPRGFGRTNARQAPVLPTLVTAVLALVFLVQEALVGFQIGVALRSITFMLVIAVVGIGWMRLRRNGAPPWAAALARRRDLLFTAPAAVFVAVVLIAMGLVQPDTPVLLQPVSQAVIALLVAAMLWAAAKRRATATQSNWPPSQGEITPNG